MDSVEVKEVMTTEELADVAIKVLFAGISLLL